MCSLSNTLAGVDAFAVTDVLESSSWADPCKLVQLKDVTVEVFTALTDTFSSPRPAHPAHPPF